MNRNRKVFMIFVLWPELSKVPSNKKARLIGANFDNLHLGTRLLASQVDRLLQSDGMEVNQVPVDRRKFNGRKDNSKSCHVDAFLNYFYHHFAPCHCPE